jgi:hypothetical protein
MRMILDFTCNSQQLSFLIKSIFYSQAIHLPSNITCPPVDSPRNLLVILDNIIYVVQYISASSYTCFLIIRDIRRIWHTTDRTTASMVLSFIHININFCNNLLLNFLLRNLIVITLFTNYFAAHAVNLIPKCNHKNHFLF